MTVARKVASMAALRADKTAGKTVDQMEAEMVVLMVA